MIVTIDAAELATELTDNDLMYKSLRATRIYRENTRLSLEYRKRYKYYFKLITSKAQIK